MVGAGAGESVPEGDGDAVSDGDGVTVADGAGAWLGLPDGVGNAGTTSAGATSMTTVASD